MSEEEEDQENSDREVVDTDEDEFGAELDEKDLKDCKESKQALAIRSSVCALSLDEFLIRYHKPFLESLFDRSKQWKYIYEFLVQHQTLRAQHAGVAPLSSSSSSSASASVPVVKWDGSKTTAEWLAAGLNVSHRTVDRLMRVAVYWVVCGEPRNEELTSARAIQNRIRQLVGSQQTEYRLALKAVGLRFKKLKIQTEIKEIKESKSNPHKRKKVSHQKPKQSGAGKAKKKEISATEQFESAKRLILLNWYKREYSQTPSLLSEINVQLKELETGFVMTVRQPFASALFWSDPNKRKTIENRTRDSLTADSWVAVIASASDFDTSKKYSTEQKNALHAQIKLARLGLAKPYPKSMLMGFVHIDECVDSEDLTETEAVWAVPNLLHWRIDRCIAVVPFEFGRAPQSVTKITCPSMKKLLQALPSLRVVFDD